jgi:hypothetical protein
LSRTVSWFAPATTWRFVRIQPLLSKMIPEPTPDCSWAVGAFGSIPSVKIRTTDGPAFAATSMIAEFSSTVTGCLTVVELDPPPAGCWTT